MIDTYLDFEVTIKADDSRYADGKDIGINNLGPIVLFSNFNRTRGSGKHLKGSSHAHILSLMYKLITSAKDTDGLSTGFDRDCRMRQQELTENKNIKDKFHVGIMLKDVFGFAEHQRRATYGVGFKLRNKDDAVSDKGPGIADL